MAQLKDTNILGNLDVEGQGSFRDRVVSDRGTFLEIESDNADLIHVRANSVEAESITVGETVMDYIVNQGTSGIWFFRCWNSGFVEMWGNYKAEVSFNITWGNMVETSIINLPSYPFEIQNVHGQASFHAAEGAGLSAAFVEFFDPQTTHAGYTTLARPQNTTVNSNVINGYISMYIVGNWK